jgi:hypothetical protein
VQVTKLRCRDPCLVIRSVKLLPGPTRRPADPQESYSSDPSSSDVTRKLNSIFLQPCEMNPRYVVARFLLSRSIIGGCLPLLMLRANQTRSPASVPSPKSLEFRCVQNGRLRGGPSRTGAQGAYLDRYVTDEQRSSRPILNATTSPLFARRCTSQMVTFHLGGQAFGSKRPESPGSGGASPYRVGVNAGSDPCSRRTVFLRSGSQGP